MFNYLKEEYIYQFIDRAIIEDVGDGDHSALSSIPKDSIGKAKLILKDEGVLAGVSLAEKIFKRTDSSLICNIIKNDGELIHYGEIALTVEGSVHSILKSERLVLNCMQRMSGIATLTNKFVKLIKGTKAKLLDTRKTTPNFRLPEKWAVQIGGGVNHRYGLFDMIILKDNHIDFAGGVAKAIKSSKEYLLKINKPLAIEVETRNLNEVQEACEEGGIQRIMLDNMSLEKMRKAVKYINGRFETEASGGINESTISEIAQTGVDFISAGVLTHSIKSLDMSLKAF